VFRKAKELGMSERRTTIYRIATSALRMAFVAIAALLAVTQLSAQSTSTYAEYAAKFVCGVPTKTPLADDVIGNAEFTTSINIHNPNLFTTDQPISFLKKAVLAKQEGTTEVAPSALKQDSLPNDYAEFVSCATIRGLLGAAAPAAPQFIEGFVVIVVPPASSPNQLDVVGVYTASNNKAAGVQPTSLQIVPVLPRIITPPPAGAAVDGKFE
jgi:hypothetical protein